MRRSWREAGRLPSDSALVLSALEAKLLAGDVSKQTHDSIVAQIEAPAKPRSASGREHDRRPAAGFAGVSEEIAASF